VPVSSASALLIAVHLAQELTAIHVPHICGGVGKGDNDSFSAVDESNAGDWRLVP
jgi:hypothetical protein